MTQPLFLDPQIDFTKAATAEVTLPEDPTNWPSEILQELYKQVPYVADFMPDVVMDRVDAEQRFGFGHVEVSNKTEIQGEPGSAMMQAAGVRHVRIPIIIKDGKLQPFDVLITEQSKMLPLTERRLRQSLFRPQLFDVTSRTPGDQSMISQLYPPYRQNYGFGGGGAVMTAGMGKEGAAEKTALSPSTIGSYLKTQKDPQALARASKSMLGRGSQLVQQGGEAAAKGQKYLKGGTIAAQRVTSAMPKAASLLTAILPTIDPTDFGRFTLQVSEPRVKAAYVANQEAMAPAVAVLAKYVPQDLQARAEKLAQAIHPSVIQIAKAPGGGYLAKTASHKMWQPLERPLDRGQVVELVGLDGALLIDKHGSVTMADDAAIGSDAPEADRPELIKGYGIYRVQAEDGKQLVGVCFSNLLDLDGMPLPMTLFTNGSQSAVQGEIAGIRVADGASLMESRPRGHGVFYQVLPNGQAQATVPLTISTSVTSPDAGAELMAETMDGRQVSIAVQPGVQRITMADEEHVVIPESFRWLSLDQTESVVLAEHPEQFSKEAHVKAIGSVWLRAGGTNIFDVSGEPTTKLAQDERSFLNIDQTLFVLGGFGVDPNYAVQKLGEAIHLQMPIEVPISREIEMASEVKEAMLKKAHDVLRKLPNLRQNLVKEAAAIPDPGAVDTVLSLGFINPENMMTFVTYLPQLDEAQSKLCELLIASRLGMRELPATALERAIRGLEDTIEGLNVVAFNKDG